ncbi:hypothetical protein L3X38_017685 [Prunus dulcis]|uniref:Reverse transcriptase/retrotransposon-derived protein RNase H-like domain-containing protein n=2 Tax=Prunus dulcis TaxID=3755 RepID=A0AAD4W7T9_PRUDU|nr:hypothetical protein L3X38_017685 [Prunus dulcis]
MISSIGRGLTLARTSNNSIKPYVRSSYVHQVFSTEHGRMPKMPKAGTLEGYAYHPIYNCRLPYGMQCDPGMHILGPNEGIHFYPYAHVEVSKPLWHEHCARSSRGIGHPQAELVEDLELVSLQEEFPNRQKRRAYDLERNEAMKTEVEKYIIPHGWPTYNQIFMHPDNQAHTSFILDQGLYCYKIGHTMEVYVDDVLKGIEANPEKIQAILDMKVPKTVKDIQSLTGRVASLTRSLRHLEGRLSGQLNLGNFIHFKPRLAEKGKVVANFILEFTKPIPSASSQIITEPMSTSNIFHLAPVGNYDLSEPLWTVHVDGSSNSQGCGAGLVLTYLDKVVMEYAI